MTKPHHHDHDNSQAELEMARRRARADAEARILANVKPCPFCGSSVLSVTDWWDEEGSYNAIACRGCKAEAPAVSWNRRAWR